MLQREQRPLVHSMVALDKTGTNVKGLARTAVRGGEGVRSLVDCKPFVVSIFFVPVRTAMFRLRRRMHPSRWFRPCLEHMKRENFLQTAKAQVWGKLAATTSGESVNVNLSITPTAVANTSLPSVTCLNPRHVAKSLVFHLCRTRVTPAFAKFSRSRLSNPCHLTPSRLVNWSCFSWKETVVAITPIHLR